MSRTYRTVRVMGDGVQKEAIAAAAFYPGHLLEKTSDGEVQKHSAQYKGPKPLIVALENSLMGIGVGTGTLNGTFVTITKAYAHEDNAQILYPQAGDEVALMLKSGETTAIGSPLTSNGDGTVVVATVSTQVVIGRALEVVTASGDTLIGVEL